MTCAVLMQRRGTMPREESGESELRQPMLFRGVVRFVVFVKAA